MSNVAKLKKRALEYEQKKQFDKALEAYAQILSELDDHVDEADVALYNRVGDLLLRQGNIADAITHYERAVDLYTDGGFFNNAIALCNKILRNSPGRNSIYYKLGKISARKGFVNDAKQNFLEYADRMQKMGEFEEAFRALKEFAELCPDQDDIRLMLADQLVRKDRKEEAVEQLQTLYEKFQAEGRTTEARATLDRMKAIDPYLEPRLTSNRPTPRSNDLIFLDVGFDAPAAAVPRNATPDNTTPTSTTPVSSSAPVVEHVEAPASEAVLPSEGTAEPISIETSSGQEISPTADLPLLHVEYDAAPPLPGVSHGTLPEGEGDIAEGLVSHVDAGFITGFEETALTGADDMQVSALEIAPLVELESTARLEGPAAAVESQLITGLSDLAPLLGDIAPLDDLAPSVHDVEFGGGDLPMLDVLSDTAGAEPKGAELEFVYLDHGPADPSARESLSSLNGATETNSVDAVVVAGEAPDASSRGDDIAAVDTSAADEIVGSLPAKAEADTSEITSLESVSSPLPFIDVGPVANEPAVNQPAEAAAEPALSLVESLRAQVERQPDNRDLRRRLGEALLESGEREEGTRQLELTMAGLERDGDLRGASAVVEELIRMQPNSVRLHQKRVEYAVRSNDKGRLADAYLSLAECLFRSGQLDKSRAVYARVLELSPEDSRARSALAALAPGEHAAKGDEQRESGQLAAVEAVEVSPAVGTVATPDVTLEPAPDGSPSAAAEPPSRVEQAHESFVNLADWLREHEATKNTRMVVEVEEPVDREDQVDFAEMLALFKQGVAANVDDTDHESHYDLGVAYKEMGLLDEAIAEFQKALRGTEHRVRTYEALGQCFVEKQQYQIALTILARALSDRGNSDDVLVGVLYLLGYASEAQEQWQDALRYYERVFAVDIHFRDVGQRLAAVERKAR